MGAHFVLSNNLIVNFKFDLSLLNRLNSLCNYRVRCMSRNFYFYRKYIIEARQNERVVGVDWCEL